MLGAIARKIFGSANDREVKALRATVEQINALEPDVEKLSDDELRARTDWLRERLKNGETLTDILPDTFATIREASKRVRGERHYDVQLLGGMVLTSGKIAEMKTGEGKTLVSTLPVYLNALEGKGVHVVTVNDYLARRDAEWMGEVYGFLGLTVGVIMHGMTDDQRREAYACDITYATNNELGFDYLRDNMKYSTDEMVQRGHGFAIVDEVDSILIDEARTPLIISGRTEDRTEFYKTINELIPLLGEDCYEIDEKARSVLLTEDGNEEIERLLKERELLAEGEALEVILDDMPGAAQPFLVAGAHRHVQPAVIGGQLGGAGGQGGAAAGFVILHLDLVAEVLAELRKIFRAVRRLEAGMGCEHLARPEF